MKKVTVTLCLCISLVCLAGCSKPSVDLALASQPNVNPDHSGRPSPIIVKNFELRNDLIFKQADFQSLFERPVQVLGADLIAADELVLIPGEARKIAYKPNPDTRYLGVVAGFRQMDRAHWRVIKPIDAENKNLIALEFNDTSILIIPDNRAEDWNPEEAVKQFQQQLAQSASSVQQNTTTEVMTTVRENSFVDVVAKQAGQQGASEAIPTLPVADTSMPSNTVSFPVRAMIPIK